jgi:hypothetical protein
MNLRGENWTWRKVTWRGKVCLLIKYHFKNKNPGRILAISPDFCQCSFPADKLSTGKLE